MGHCMDDFLSFYVNPVLPQNYNRSAEYNPGALNEQVPRALA